MMMKSKLLLAGLALCSLFSSAARASLDIPRSPLYIRDAASPMVMLLIARDHTIYSEAYNDFTDLNDDGVLDTYYITDPSFKYYGYFDSGRCYSYTDNRFEPGDATSDKTCSASTGSKWSGDFLNYVTSSRLDILRKVLYGGYRQTDDNTGTNTTVVLRSSFVPRDSHSWGKSYDRGQNYLISAYTPLTDISGDKTTDGKNYQEKVFFARVSDSYGSAPLLKIFKFKTLNNNYSQYIWNWVSKERPVAGNRLALDGISNGNRGYATNCAGEKSNGYVGEDAPKEDECTGTTLDTYGHIASLNVDVRVCKSGSQEENCKDYGGRKVPVGILQDYGSNGKVKFGLLTGSYSNNLQGGVLRAPIAHVGQTEIVSADGKVKDTSKIIATLNGLQMLNFNYTQFLYGFNSKTTCGVFGFRVNRAITNGECSNWGNPLAEMFYESLRYFAGKTAATDAFDYGNNDNALDGGELALPKNTTWTNPYTANTCNKPFNLIISDVNPNYDGDNIGSDLPGFTSAPTWTEKLSARESLEADTSRNFTSGRSYFVGQTALSTSSASPVSAVDKVPTAKLVTNLSEIRGLPQEPSKGGSYQLAGLAYYAHTRGIGASANQQYKTVDTMAVALSSPIPEIKIKMPKPLAPGGTQEYYTIRLFPYARSVAYCVLMEGKNFGNDTINVSNEERCVTGGYKPGNDASKAYVEHGFQPTASIVDFYVTKLTDTEGEFRVSFDDNEQGADYDMDMVVLYKYKVNNGTLEVTTSTEYSSVAMNVHAGYTIAGTTADGLYLDIRDKTFDDNNKDSENNTQYDWRFYLDTPKSTTSPYPNNTDGRTGDKQTLYYPQLIDSKYNYNALSEGRKNNYPQLPLTQTRTFTPSGLEAAILPSPLWFAAKWGGYEYKGSSEHTNTAAIVAGDWAKNPSAAASQMVPKNYYPVNNPGKLKEQLEAALNNIEDRNYTGAGVAIGDPTFDATGNKTSSSLIFQTQFYQEGWVGDLVAYKLENDLFVKQWSAGPLLKTPNIATRNILVKNSAGTGLTQLKDLTATDPRLTAWQSRCPTGVTDPTTCFNSVRDYLAGDRSNEGNGYRKRSNKKRPEIDWVLGDIINSKPATEKDGQGRQIVVVAANDGMVHIFNAANGSELAAYIPSPVLPKLEVLASPDYSHRYFVDGSITLAWIKDGATSKLVAIGAYGYGSQASGTDATSEQGLYALDLTDAASPTLLWELSETDLSVVSGSTRYSDLGYMVSAPAVKLMADDKWWAIFGNGYNSDKGVLNSQAGRGVVYMVNVNDKSDYQILDTQVGSGADQRDGHTYNNGIAQPFVADMDGDSKGDAIFAGDLFGNLWMWKWNSTDSAMKSLLEDGSHVPLPIFISRSSADENPYGNKLQAITTRPVVGRSKGKTMVFWGTGKYIETPDAVNTNVSTATRNITQTIYGLNINGLTATATRADLLQQRIIAQAKDSNLIEKRALSSTPIPANKKGWFLDLWGVTNTTTANNTAVTRKGNNEGERVSANPYLRFDTLVVVSSIPPIDECSSVGSNWYYEFKAFEGISVDQADPSQPNWADKAKTRKADDGVPTDPDVDGNDIITNPTDPSGIKTNELKRPSSGRLSWRQLF